MLPNFVQIDKIVILLIYSNCYINKFNMRFNKVNLLQECKVWYCIPIGTDISSNKITFISIINNGMDKLSTYISYASNNYGLV